MAENMAAGNGTLADILGGISQYITQVGKNKDSASGSLEQNAQLRNESIAAMQKAGQLNQEIEAIDAGQAMQMEARKAATAKAFGTDILDPDNRIAYLAQEQIAAQDEALARSKRASELIDMNIFDSPLEYMVQRPFADRHVQASVAAKGRAEMLDKAIMDANQQTQATIKTQEAINVSLTAEEVEKRAMLSKMKAEEIIRTAQIAKNTADINDIKILREMDADQLKWAGKAYELRNHEMEFQARMAEARAAREARAQAQKDKQNDSEYAWKRFNIGARMVNLPQIPTLEDFKNYVKVNKDSKRIANMIELGNTVEVDPTNEQRFLTPVQLGATPGKAQLTLEYFNGRMDPTAERTAALLATASNLVKDKLKSESNGKIDQDSLVRGIDGVLKGSITEGKKGQMGVKVPGLVEGMAANAEQDAGQIKNIYRAPDVKVMESILTTYAQTPEWQAIVRPAVKASGMSPTVESMLAQARIAAQQGTVPPEKSAQLIATYFREATRANNINEKYLNVGLPAQSNYPVQVKTGGKMFGDGIRVIDAANEQQVLHHLMKEIPLPRKSDAAWWE